MLNGTISKILENIRLKLVECKEFVHKMERVCTNFLASTFEKVLHELSSVIKRYTPKRLVYMSNVTMTFGRVVYYDFQSYLFHLQFSRKEIIMCTLCVLAGWITHQVYKALNPHKLTSQL